MIAKLWAALALLAAMPAEAAWKRAESHNFVVYGQGSEASLREQTALLEDYHAFVRSLTGIKDPPAANKLSVYMVRGLSDLRVVRPVSRDTAGFYTASGSGIAAFADERSGLRDQQILLHEIAHHLMMQYRPLPYPGWYVEGFAEYLMTAKFDKDSIEYGLPSAHRVSWLTYSQWMPLDRVLFAQGPRTPEQNALFYAQSWLLVHYLLRDSEQRPKLIQYIAAVAKGEEPKKAFGEAFGITVKQMDSDLRSYARKSMTYTRLKRASVAEPPPIKITQLSAAAEDLLLLKAAMDVRDPGEESQTLLKQVRATAAKHPEDPFATRVLAQAEALYGDGARADALLDPLLVAAPNDAELLYLKGMRHLAVARADKAAPEAAHKEARRWFVRAHKADENHYPTLIRYAESLSSDQRFLSDNTINILLLAYELAPQIHETAINAGGLLLARGRFDEAENLLLPLASSPHEGGEASKARELLAMARAKQKPEAAQLASPPAAKE
jgi:tetratricopeptide (TPR) repeat protein